jgi:hypothetical protein
MADLCRLIDAYGIYSGMVLKALKVALQAYFGEVATHLGRLHIAINRKFGLSRHRWWFLLK